MKLLSLTVQDRMIVRTEIQGFFHHRRSLHIVPLSMAGIFLMAWIYPVGSPFAPIMMVVFAGLELQFNNILFRTWNEFEAMSLFPISWKHLIYIKNVTTIALVLLAMIILSMTLLFFSPAYITFKEIADALFYMTTVIFPLLHLGNRQSYLQGDC
jgi:hypothetical protein